MNKNLDSCNLTRHFIHNHNLISMAFSPTNVHVQNHGSPIHAFGTTSSSLNLNDDDKQFEILNWKTEDQFWSNNIKIIILCRYKISFAQYFPEEIWCSKQLPLITIIVADMVQNHYLLQPKNYHDWTLRSIQRENKWWGWIEDGLIFIGQWNPLSNKCI